MRLSKLLLILAIIFLSGCCKPSVVYKPTPALILELPDLPLLTPAQEAAIEEETYKVLVAREATLKLHIQNQKELIEIHNGG